MMGSIRLGVQLHLVGLEIWITALLPSDFAHFREIAELELTHAGVFSA